MGLYTRRRTSILGRLSHWKRLDLKQRMKEYPVLQSVRSVCSRSWRTTTSFGEPPLRLYSAFTQLKLPSLTCQATGHRTRGSKTIPRFRILGRRPQEIHRDGKSKPYAYFSSNRQGSSFYFPKKIFVRVFITRFKADFFDSILQIEVHISTKFWTFILPFSPYPSSGLETPEPSHW